MRRLAMATAAATFAAVLAGPGAEATAPACGQVVRHSIRLAVDLVACGADGLVAGAPKITIDLGGHTVSGANLPDRPEDASGVRNPKGYAGVVIQNGTIAGFVNGVLVFGGSRARNVIRNLRLVSNVNGIYLRGSGSNQVTSNELEDNDAGIAVAGNRNVVSDNRISMPSSSRRQALSFLGGSNVFSGNEVRGGTNGVTGSGSSDTITGGDISSLAGWGVNVVGSGNVVRGTTVDGVGGTGIRLGSAGDDQGGRVASSLVRRAGGDGILVEPEGAVIKGNVSSSNGGDGIHVQGGNAVIVSNDARGNGGFGIVAEDGAAASDNHASGNAAGQCSPADLCT